MSTSSVMPLTRKAANNFRFLCSLFLFPLCLCRFCLFRFCLCRLCLCRLCLFRFCLCRLCLCRLCLFREGWASLSSPTLRRVPHPVFIVFIVTTVCHYSYDFLLSLAPPFLPLPDLPTFTLHTTCLVVSHRYLGNNL